MKGMGAFMDEVIRLVKKEELGELLELYRHLHAEDPELETDNAINELWDCICNNPDLYYIAVEVGGRLISSCNISIIKNLTRGARPFGLIENVVTHPEYRKKGYATKALHKALDIARENNCYKVMLMTSSKREETLRFYEKAGFDRGTKTGFVVYFE